MKTKKLKIAQIAENLLIISGVSAILGTGLVLILKEIQTLTF